MTAPEGPAYTELIPRPDPTRLTSEAVNRATDIFRRELQALRDLHDKDLAALRELLDARLEGMDRDRIALRTYIDDVVRRFTEAIDQFRVEVDHRDSANRQLVEQRLNDLDKARADSTTALADALASEREYVMGQIANSLAETRRVGDVSQEKFAAVDALFASNALALAAALAAQEKAVAAQNDSNTLAIAKSESSHQGDDQRQRGDGADRAVQPRQPGQRHQRPGGAHRVDRGRGRRAARRAAGQHRHGHRGGRHPHRRRQLRLLIVKK